MSQEDGWGNVVDILQNPISRKKRKNEYTPHPLPDWMKKSIISDEFHGSEYIEFNLQFFAGSHKQRKIDIIERDKVSVVTKAQSNIVEEKKDEKHDIGKNLDVDLLNNLRKSLEQLQNKPPPHSLPAQFNYLNETNALPEALEHLNLHTLKDELLAEICRQFITLNSSYVQSMAFAKFVLLPKVTKLETTATRVVMGGLVHCTRVHPLSILNSLLIPLVSSSAGSVQSEVVNRIAFVEKCLTPELCQQFIREILVNKQEWNDPFIQLLTNALNSNIQSTEEIASLIVTHANKQVDSFSTNPKFAKLIFTFISKYPSFVKPHSTSLQQTLAKCNNFMAKSAITQLEKLG